MLFTLGGQRHLMRQMWAPRGDYAISLRRASPMTSDTSRNLQGDDNGPMSRSQRSTVRLPQGRPIRARTLIM